MGDAQFAPDAEEAVDYLAHIQDEINAFHRVDTGKNQEFENNEDAHYQWIIIPDDEDMNGSDDEDINENDGDDDQVAFEDIMIGFRHSYGGYHRILKQYRKAGFDPALQAAKHHAEQFAHSSHDNGGNGNGGVTTPNSANS